MGVRPVHLLEQRVGAVEIGVHYAGLGEEWCWDRPWAGCVSVRPWAGALRLRPEASDVTTRPGAGGVVQRLRAGDAGDRGRKRKRRWKWRDAGSEAY